MMNIILNQIRIICIVCHGFRGFHGENGDEPDSGQDKAKFEGNFKKTRLSCIIAWVRKNQAGTPSQQFVLLWDLGR